MKTKANSLNSNISSSWIGAGLLVALTASLCCITPVLALLSGVSGLAATFSWMEPVRPFLIVLTIGILGFTWYQKLKPRNQGGIECNCERDEKPSFWQSKTFLIMVTIFVAVMLVFPSYSGIFFPKHGTMNTVTINEAHIIEASLTIKGMTCTGCEHSVNHTLTGSEGVIEAFASYETGTASVKFDKSKTSIDKLAIAVEKETGYKVIEKQVDQN